MIQAVLVLLLLLSAPVARAAESAPVQSPRATVTLVSDTDQVKAGQPLHLGLRFRLAPGWHTYWKNPGDAGGAATLHLSLPEGAKAGPILWPVPHRLLDGPVMSYAYTGDTTLPVAVTPGPGPLHVTATATWLVCATLCVPEHGQFTLNLPVGQPAPSPQAPLIDASLKRLPKPSPFHASVTPAGMLTVQGKGLSPQAVASAWVLPANPGRIVQSAPQRAVIRQGIVRIQLKPFKPHVLDSGLDGVMVLRDRSGQEAFLKLAAAPGAAPTATGSGAGLPVPRALLLAFLAGVILNAMPCVFPVLALKAAGIAKLAGAGRTAVRRSALAYTAGVLAAFLILGGVLLAARAAGQTIGWGAQFQSPAFVVGMAWLLFLVGLNLSGVFEMGAGLAGAGQSLTQRGGLWGDVFTGLLAVVVATPCTAPFMGAAIAAALAASPAEMLLVFAAMGLGLAAPYALMAFVPGAARLLPRPGTWMVLLKQALAFPMYAAAAWLLWVASQQAGPDAVLGAAAGFVLLGFAGWAWGLAQGQGDISRRRLGHSAAFAAALAAAAILVGVATAPPGATHQALRDAEPYSPARLAALRANGQPVFLNATAAWCVTCLVNERVALDRTAVRHALRAHGIHYLIADWTRGDPAVTQLLHQQGRDGVPLYLVFPAGGGPPRRLPQILTERIVLDSLRWAAQPARTALR